MKESVVNIKDVIYQDTPENKSEETMVEASAFEEKISSISERKKAATETDNISVKEDDVNGEVIPYEINTDEIVTIGAISDTKGILSDRIDAVMQEYHVRAIQVEAAGILPQVTELQRHDLLKLNDVNYAMSRDVDKKMLLAYRQTIYDTLSSGLPYREILTDTITIDDKEYHTMKMTKQEWDYLCSAYRNYNSRLVLDESGNLNLLVG
jgi:hypothetical protein